MEAGAWHNCPSCAHSQEAGGDKLGAQLTFSLVFSPRCQLKGSFTFPLVFSPDLCFPFCFLCFYVDFILLRFWVFFFLILFLIFKFILVTETFLILFIHLLIHSGSSGDWILGPVHSTSTHLPQGYNSRLSICYFLFFVTNISIPLVPLIKPCLPLFFPSPCHLPIYYTHI